MRNNQAKSTAIWAAVLVAIAGSASGQELEPSMDLPTPHFEEAAAAPARRLAPAEVVRGAATKLATAASPSRVAGQIRTNYQDRRFFATDYSEHASPVKAMAASVKPLNMRANIRASVRNGMSPLSLVGTLITPMSMELQRELVTDGKLSPSKLIHAFEPGAIVGGLAGGLTADVLGAAAQSALAGTMGPIGPVAGFLVRPMIGYSAFLIGSNFGRSVQHGKPSLKGSLAQSLRQIDPARDTGALIGGSIGAVVGQAIIPVPVLGGIVGGTLGGLVGTTIGNWIGKHGVTGKADKGAIAFLQRTADRLDGGTEKQEKPASPAAANDSPEVPVQQREAGPVERFDSQYVMTAPVATTPAATPGSEAGCEVTPDDALTSDFVMAH